jgi:hypothetical protein
MKLRIGFGPAGACAVILAQVTGCSAEVGRLAESTSTASSALTGAVCLAFGADTDCGTIITVSNTGISITSTGQGPYDSIEDTLVGVVNNSMQPIRLLTLKSSATIFGFDGDGIDTYGAPGNAQDDTGYGGPNTYFSGISGDRTSGTANFVVPIPANGGTTYFSLEDAVSNAISCQDVVNGAVSAAAAVGTQISATFTPNLGLALGQAAVDCGFTNFDWQQTITSWPAPSPLFQRGNATALVSPPPFLDPPPGGYTYQAAPDNSYPFYYDAQSGELASHETATMLSFLDAPADPCLPGASGALCAGKTAPAGSFLGFVTHLAGVNSDGTATDLGIGFSWKSTFNGTSGGTVATKNDLPVDPGSGTGGITITSTQTTTNYQYNGITVTGINGAPLTSPPTITALTATPAILWPPNNKMVAVALNVTASDGTATRPTCAITSVVSNEPDAGTVDWALTGPLALTLRAERLGSGTGRLYTITVTCSDASPFTATQDVTVTVPHDQSP